MTGPRSTPAQRWVLALSALASFMVVLDMLVVATALSAIQRDLGASLADLEWTVNAYTLSFAVLLMTGASLGDRYGRRRVFAAGLVIFPVASVGCALSPNVGALVTARTVQGAGAALIMPLALGLLNSVFPPERRGWATGVFGGVTGMAAVLGPVVGGAVTQAFDWQWVFWVNVPIALVVVSLVRARVPESRGTAERLDLPGIGLAGAAAFGMTWGLVRGHQAGWASLEVLGSLCGGAVLVAALVAWELRARAPMLPMRLFRSGAFSAGNAAIFFMNGGLTGAIFLTAQYHQVALGAGPLAAGLRLLPWGAAPFLVAPRAGALADRLGTRPLAVAGCLLIAAGMGWLALAAGGPYPAMIAPMALGGLGLGIAVPATTTAVISLVAGPDIGRAAGAYSTLRQLGGVFGVAVAGVVFTAAGGAASPARFAAGYAPAIGVTAGLALAAAVAALALPRRRPAPAMPTTATAPPPEPADVAA